MTTLPVPTFTIGQQVWGVVIDGQSERYQCPDCLGTERWTARTAAGEDIDVSCPRCTGYTGRDLPSLSRWVHTARAAPLTIGSVQIDTAAKKGEAIRYMCRETGVGSGSVYHEGGQHGLYATEAEALAAAATAAAEMQAKQDERPESLKAAAFATIPLKAALPYQERGEVFAAWQGARQYREAIEEALENKRLHGDVADSLADALERPSWVEPHPLDALIDATRVLLNPEGHIWHGGGVLNVCTGECEALRGALAKVTE